MTGALLPFDPQFSFLTPHAVQATASELIVAGGFTQVDGQPRHYVARFDRATLALGPATATSSLGGGVARMRLSPTHALLNGDFPAKLAAVRLSDGAVDLSFAPVLAGTPTGLALDCASGTLVVSGNALAPTGPTIRSVGILRNPPGCAEATSAPSLTDDQAGDDTWRSTNVGTWAVSFADAQGLQGFDTQVRTAPAGGGALLQDWTQVAALSGTRFTTPWALRADTFAAMVEGVNHVSVRVRDTDGAQAVAQDAFHVRKDTVPPLAVASLTASAAAQPLLSWPAASDATSGVAYYRVYRATGGGAFTLLSVDGQVSAPGFLDATAPVGAQLTYRVQAVDAAGTSRRRAATAQVTTPGPDGAPCAAGAQCQSGFCVDGVCCDGACAGGCEACSVAAGAAVDGSCRRPRSVARPPGPVTPRSAAPAAPAPARPTRPRWRAPRVWTRSSATGWSVARPASVSRD